MAETIAAEALQRGDVFVDPHWPAHGIKQVQHVRQLCATNTYTVIDYRNLTRGGTGNTSIATGQKVDRVRPVHPGEIAAVLALLEDGSYLGVWKYDGRLYL